MGLVFYSARAGYDDRASHNDNANPVFHRVDFPRSGNSFIHSKATAIVPMPPTSTE